MGIKKIKCIRANGTINSPTDGRIREFPASFVKSKYFKRLGWEIYKADAPQKAEKKEDESKSK